MLTRITKAMIDPELKGRPIVFTKNISKALKYLRILGAKSLNTNSKTAIPARFAKIKFLTVIVL
jgi:hypothetical protein